MTDDEDASEYLSMTLFRSLALICTMLVAAGATTQPATAPSTQTASQPVPLLTPEEEAATFNLPKGFKAEVVAAEPMVQHPVAIAFDPRGRMWVAEMRGYMPDTEGWGENKPTGRVSILEDTDGDGRMDKATVFLDKLVLPRAIGFAGDGVLIGSPTKLLFCRDTNADGQADSIETIATDFGAVENPEFSANGLLYNLDNWIYCANWNKRIRYRSGKFEFDAVPAFGEFGISRDDFGRLYFDSNSDYLRGALVPPHYSARNPSSPMPLADTRIAKDQKVWPAHASTVNRGYREGFLRDGRLDAFTAACGPHIYRATLLGDDFYGNAFACEAAANLVRRSIVSEKDGIVTAKNAYADREFIASTDERFRPVALSTGPEGALYVVDMHHGLIQHRISLTDWAKAEYKKKQLNKNNLTGRIFRIVPDHGVVAPVHLDLANATTSQLVLQLTHPNGWWRDTAQRLLVERNDAIAVAPLEDLAQHAKRSFDRLTALWTLDGMGRLSAAKIESALRDPDAKVRANAIRLAESRVSPSQRYDQSLDRGAAALASDRNPEVQLQFALSFASKDHGGVTSILHDAGDNRLLREAAVSGLAEKEIAYLGDLLNDAKWQSHSSGRASVMADVAKSVFRRNKPDEVTALVDLIGIAPQPWQKLALLEAVPPILPDEFGAARPIRTPQKPATIDRLTSSGDADIRSRAERVAALFEWPGKPVPPRPPVAPLTPREQQLFEIGRVQFATICAQCHKIDGTGQEGKAPPLVHSPWALGPSSRVIRIVLHGAHGPIPVGDRTFNLDMPALKALSDEQIAGALTYVRRSWGHEASPIDPAMVQSIRDWTQARRDGWTAKELLAIR